jgi:hypothetical protein
MGLKVGKRLSNKKCKWDGEWKVYECGLPHSGLFGPVQCSTCNNTKMVCASGNHPSNKKPYDW